MDVNDDSTEVEAKVLLVESWERKEDQWEYRIPMLFPCKTEITAFFFEERHEGKSQGARH